MSLIGASPYIPVTPDEDDRISALPDGILCHILSFMPTKNAAVTSVLSTRWKSLYALTPGIELDDSLIANSLGGTEARFWPLVFMFVRFGTKLFEARGDSINVDRFCLRCTTLCETCVINTWIVNALKLGVKEFDVSLRVPGAARITRDEILQCISLVVLKLEGRLYLNVPRVVTLPKLKVLHLVGMMLLDADSARRVFKGCPLLEDLSLLRCYFDAARILEISSCSLKKISIVCCGSSYRLEIDAPNLEYLEYQNIVGDAYLIKNLHSLAKAEISIGLSKQQREENSAFHIQKVPDFISGIGCVKSLCLSDDSQEVLYNSLSPLPMFPNLTLLELGEFSNSQYWSSHVDEICAWKLLPKLLECAPNLETLVLNKELLRYDSDDEEFECPLPEIAPTCLAQHLREIEFRRFYGKEYEFKLVQYFLQTGKVLTTIKIGSTKRDDSTESPSYICQRLSVLPRCSEVCQIVFT